MMVKLRRPPVAVRRAGHPRRDYDIAAGGLRRGGRRRSARSTPYVVLDLPHLWTPWMRRTLLAADDIVIVADARPRLLRNAKNIVDLVRAARPNDAPPRLVLNKVGVPRRPEIPVKDFGEALGLEPPSIDRLRRQAVRPGRQQRPDAGGGRSPKSQTAESIDAAGAN